MTYEQQISIIAYLLKRIDRLERVVTNPAAGDDEDDIIQELKSNLSYDCAPPTDIWEDKARMLLG